MAQRPSSPPHSPSSLPSVHHSSAFVLCGLSAGTHGGKVAKRKKKEVNFFSFHCDEFHQNLIVKT